MPPHKVLHHLIVSPKLRAIIRTNVEDACSNLCLACRTHFNDRDAHTAASTGPLMVHK